MPFRRSFIGSAPYQHKGSSHSSEHGCKHQLVLFAEQFKAKAERNVLYEQEDSDNDSSASQSSKKSRYGKTKNGSSKGKKSKGSGSGKKQSGKDRSGKRKKKNRDASSDEEEVQGPQLTNIMQIMEQQQRYHCVLTELSCKMIC